MGSIIIREGPTAVHDKPAFLALFLEHYAALYGFVLRQGVKPEDADDLVQDVATVLWEKFASFEPGSNFKAWAFSIARLEVLKRCDRRRRETRTLRLEPAALEAIEQIEEGDDALSFERDRLRACLGRLSASMREIFDLHYSQGLAYEDIAQRLGMKPATLRTRVCRARKWLEDCVRRAGP